MPAKSGSFDNVATDPTPSQASQLPQECRWSKHLRSTRSRSSTACRRGRSRDQRNAQFVGAGLPAKSGCHSTRWRPTLRLRRQASSHRDAGGQSIFVQHDPVAARLAGGGDLGISAMPNLWERACPRKRGHSTTWRPTLRLRRQASSHRDAGGHGSCVQSTGARRSRLLLRWVHMAARAASGSCLRMAARMASCSRLAR